MPVAKCAVCHQRWTIRKKEWKFLDQDGPYVCSLDCLTKWVKIERDFLIQRDLPENSWVVRAPCILPFESWRLHCSFRSHFELNMAEYFVKQGLVFQYEYVTFLWEGKEYTPDFYFPKYGCFVEVKGLWQNSNRSKYKDFRQTFPMVNMIIGHWLLSNELPKKEMIGGII